MSIAVLIPTLNYGRYIEQCLQSIRDQTVAPDEVLIIDGGSEDGTPELWFRRWSDMSRMIYCPPGGAGHARNFGFRRLFSDWVIPLDADDWIEPRYIERVRAEALAADPMVGVIAPALIWPDGRIQYPKEPINRETIAMENRLFSCSMVRRRAWELTGGYSEQPKIYEDWLFWARLLAAGWTITAVREGLYHYRPHEESSSAKMANQEAEYTRRTRALIAAAP